LSRLSRILIKLASSNTLPLTHRVNKEPRNTSKLCLSKSVTVQ
jgi:hypothetical protein